MDPGDRGRAGLAVAAPAARFYGLPFQLSRTFTLALTATTPGTSCASATARSRSSPVLRTPVRVTVPSRATSTVSPTGFPIPRSRPRPRRRSWTAALISPEPRRRTGWEEATGGASGPPFGSGAGLESPPAGMRGSAGGFFGAGEEDTDAGGEAGAGAVGAGAAGEPVDAGGSAGFWALSGIGRAVAGASDVAVPGGTGAGERAVKRPLT